jgi:hypothetical protein
MKSNSSVSTVFLDKRKLAITVVLMLIVTGVISFRIMQNIHTAEVLQEVRNDPNFVFFTPLADASQLLKWKPVPFVDPKDTTLAPEILHFFNSYNAIRAKIMKVTIDGESLWPGYSDDRAWTLHFEWNRKDRTVSVESEGQKCLLKDTGAFIFTDNYYGSMHTNLLHFVMLASWDPRLFEFASITDDILLRKGFDGAVRSIDVKVLTYKEVGAAFYFEKDTGRLVRIEGPLLNYGTFLADMDNFVLIDKSHNIVLPTFTRLKVPDGLFSVPLPLRFDRVIELRFDPNNIQLEYL